MRFDECPCSGKNLMRLLRPAILRALAEKPLHGYMIAQHLGELAMFKNQPADAAGLYRTLKEMEKEGLLTSEWDTGEKGPARRLYRLTSGGRECLKQWERTLSRYLDMITDMLAWMSKGS